MGSSGQNTTTQTVTSLPPAYIADQLPKVANAATSLYLDKVGPQYYTGNTVVPFNTMTQNALTGAYQSALSNPLQNKAFGAVGNVIGNNGVTSGTQGALGTLGGIASGNNAINTQGQYQHLIDNAGGVAGQAQPSLGLLGNIASGANSVWTGDDYARMQGQAQQAGVGNIGAYQGMQGQAQQAGVANAKQYQDMQREGKSAATYAGAYGNLRSSDVFGGLARGSQDAINTMRDYASGNYGIGTEGDVRGTAAQYGGQTAADQYGRGIASGAQRVGTEADYRAELARTGGQTAADQYLTGMASGANIGGNPFLKAEIERSNQQLRDQINSGMAGSGRYGSGAHTGVLADKLSANTNTALFNQYNQDLQNQLASTGMIDSARMALGGQRAGLLGAITGVQGQNLQNQMGAAGLMDSSKMAQGGLQRGFMQDVTGIQGANVANQMGAANNLFGSLQGANNDWYARQMAGIQGMLGAQGQGFQQQLAALTGQTGAQGQNFAQQLGALQGGTNAQNQQFQQQLGALAGQTGVETNNLAAQTAASNNLANFYQQAQNQGFQNRLQGIQGLSGVQGANIANQGNTAQTMANVYQNAQDQALKASLAAPALAETRFNDYSRQADIGAQYENKAAEELKDKIARFEFGNMQPWNQLGLYSNALMGINSGGVSNTVTQRPEQPLGQRILGGGVAGGALGAQMGGIPGGLLGLLGGGLLGGFM